MHSGPRTQDKFLRIILFLSLWGWTACTAAKNPEPPVPPMASTVAFPSPSPKPEKVLKTVAPEVGNPKDALREAFNNFLALKSFKAIVDTNTAQGMHHNYTVDYLAPDRYRMNSVSVIRKHERKQQTVIIGPSTYMKMGESAWRKFPIDVGAMVNAFRDPKILEQIQNSTQVDFVGEESLGDRPMRVYRYSVENVMGLKVKSDCKAWISIADKVPVKIEVDGEYAGVKSHTTIEYSDFNAEFKIEAPL